MKQIILVYLLLISISTYAQNAPNDSQHQNEMGFVIHNGTNSISVPVKFYEIRANNEYIQLFDGYSQAQTGLLFNFELDTDGHYAGSLPHALIKIRTHYHVIVNGHNYHLYSGERSEGASSIDVKILMKQIGGGFQITYEDKSNNEELYMNPTPAVNLSNHIKTTIKQTYNTEGYGKLGYSNEVINSVKSVEERYENGFAVLSPAASTKYVFAEDILIKSINGIGYQNQLGILFRNWENNNQSYIKSFSTSTNNSVYEAKMDDKSSFTAPMTVDGISSASTIKLYDPYYIDPTDGVQKPTFGREMRTLYQNTAPVFKDIEINGSLSPYELQLNSIDVSGNPIYYLNHVFSNITAPLFSTTNKFKLRFDGTPIQSSSLSVNFKGHLRTAQPNNAYTKNQRRFAVNGSNQILVYESMGDIWVTTSTDGGTIWSQEKRLNVRQGYAKNPTLSNVLTDNKVAISWIETNASNAVELHVQTASASSANFWGWASETSQSVNNHKKQTDFNLTTPPFLASPSLYLRQNGATYEILFAYESSLGIKAGKISTTTDLNAGTGSYYGLGYTSQSDKFPNILYVPSISGFTEKIFVYYTRDSGNGDVVAQYDAMTGLTYTTTVPAPAVSTGQYSCLGLQAATSGGTVLLLYQGSSAGGEDVLVFGKHGYSTNPTYWSRYLKATNSTLSNASTIPYATNSMIYFKSTDAAYLNHWFSVEGSYSPRDLGTNATGIWTKEKAVNATDYNHYFVTNETLAKIQKLVGSGTVNKTNSNSGEMFNVIANRFWSSANDTNQTVLDFSGADIEILRENQVGSLILSAKINSVSEDGLIVTQPDSLMTPLSVELVHDGVVVRSYSASEWSELSQTAIQDFTSGDVLNFRVQNGLYISGNEDMILSEKSSGLNKRRDSKSAGTNLKAQDQRVSAYPNPFNPATTLKITLPKVESHVSFEVYNMLGQIVKTFVNGKLEAGEHTYQFDGSHLATGTYIYRLVIGDKVQSGKISLVK